MEKRLTVRYDHQCFSTETSWSQTDDDTKVVTKTIDPAALNEVSTQITLRLLSGDGAALDSVAPQ